MIRIASLNDKSRRWLIAKLYPQDSDPELTESFLVELTGVQLVGGRAIAGAAPTLRTNERFTTVEIGENDQARGVVQFGVSTVIPIRQH